MKKYSAIIVNAGTGIRKTVSENSREALILTLQTWLDLDWHVLEFF